MQRLIDANALNFEKLQDTNDEAVPANEYIAFLKGAIAAEELIKNAPNIDAEPVVYCKNCKYHIEHKYSPAFYKCKQVSFLKGRLVSSKFGCVLGAKMDEEQECEI